MTSPATARRRGVKLLASGTVLMLTGALAPAIGSASSHREAPLIAAEPQLDNTDVYAFVSPDNPDSVTLIANWVPLQEPSGGPTYYPFADGAHYDINIDNDHDAVADITYRWTFSSSYQTEDTFLYNTGPVTTVDDADLNFRQTYKLEEIDGAGVATTLIDNAPVAPSHVGNASIPDYTPLRDGAIVPVDNGGRSYVGQADEPFFLDLRVFDLLYGGDLSEVGDDTTAGYNVNVIALQVPKSELALGGDDAANPIVGIWSDTEAAATTVRTPGAEAETGEFIQVSRLGMPLVNEVVIPLKDKDNFNGSLPADDGQFLDYVTDPELARLIELIYGIPAPATPRDDLVSVFLTGVEGLNKPENGTPSEQLRLNMSIAPSANPERLGVLAGDNAGFPNGRRLTDDIVDISIQVVEGELVGNPNDLGDGVNSNDKAFLSSFPYVALPHSGPATGTGANGSQGGKTAPSGGVATGVATDANLALIVMGGMLAFGGAGFAASGLLARRRELDAA